MIQVLGAGGMLGQAVVASLAKWHYTYATIIQDIAHVEADDIQDGGIVINCAGIIKQKGFHPPSRYMLVNAYGPHRLAEACARRGTRLIHVSTDCVFQGPGPHHESDVPDASDIYARSKRAGEIIEDFHLTVRLSFVGLGNYGLVAELKNPKNIVKASTNLFWTGNTVNVVAEMLLAVAQRRDIIGLIHMPGCEMNRWELCQAITQHFGWNTQIERDDSFIADRRLDASRWLEMGLPRPPPFDVQLRQWT